MKAFARLAAVLILAIAVPALAGTQTKLAQPTTVPSSFAGNLTLSAGVLSITGSVGAAAPLQVQGAVQTSGVNGIVTVTGAASTGQTASTEVKLVNFNLAQTVTWATGALTTERVFLLQAPTLAFAGASTVTNAATLDITNAPQAGTNATITNPWALRVEAGASTFGGAVSLPHVVGNSSAPATPTPGTGCGTSSAATNAGTDLAGNLGVTCGATGSTSATVLTLTFASSYATAPYCMIEPANAATAAIAVAQQVWVSTTQSTLVLKSNGTGLGAATYLWNYVCSQ